MMGCLSIAIVVLPKMPGIWQVIVFWFLGGILIGAGFGSLFDHTTLGALGGFVFQMFTLFWLASQMGRAPTPQEINDRNKQMQHSRDQTDRPISN
jgi:hypothetical protein